MTNLNDLAYHVGVKHRFLPFYRKFKVVGHVNEQVGDVVRLVLRCADGSLVCVPDVGRKGVKVYPDFVRATEAQKRLKDQGVTPNAEPNGQ